MLIITSKNSTVLEIKEIAFSTRQMYLIKWYTWGLSAVSLQIKNYVRNRFCAFILPEGNGRNPSHQSVRSDTLQVEQGAVEKQQQDHVLTEDEAPPTLPDHREVLETWRRSTTTININNLDLYLQACHVSVSVISNLFYSFQPVVTDVTVLSNIWQQLLSYSCYSFNNHQLYVHNSP